MFTRFLYANYQLQSSVQWRMRRRFTQGGLLIVTGLGASALLGAHISLTMAYQAFTFLLSLLVISLLCSAFFRPRLTVRRILPRFGTMGQLLPYRLQVRNTGSKTLRGLILLDDLADPDHPCTRSSAPESRGRSGGTRSTVRWGTIDSVGWCRRTRSPWVASNRSPCFLPAARLSCGAISRQHDEEGWDSPA